MDSFNNGVDVIFNAIPAHFYVSLNPWKNLQVLTTGLAMNCSRSPDVSLMDYVGSCCRLLSPDASTMDSMMMLKLMRVSSPYLSEMRGLNMEV